jgi:hypothetical protein
MFFVFLSLWTVASASTYNLLGLELPSSFFTNEYVTRQIWVGNVSQAETYLYNEVNHKEWYNSSGSDVFLPLVVTSSAANTIEMVLSVDIFPELLQVCIWKDHKGMPITTLESSRVEVCKTCSDFFDECIQQMHMRYNKQPPHLAPGYNFRMVARMDEAEGHWTIRLSRKPLPHHAVIAVHLAITTKEYEVALVAWAGAVFFAAVSAAIALLVAAVLTFGRRPVLLVASAPAASTPTGERRRLRAVAAFFSRMGAFLSHRRAERYTHMQADQPDGAGPAANGAPEPLATGPPPATAPPTDEESRTTPEGPTATSSSAPPLMQQLLTRGLIQAPNVVAIEDDDDENFCRICRCVEPQADLFSPCHCDGSMKYVHRACLAEWREKTTNPENRQFCSECKAPFRIVARDAALQFVVDSLGRALRLTVPLLALEAALLGLGYGFKGVAGVLQGDVHLVDWDPGWYHHCLGLQVLVVYLVHFHVLSAALAGSSRPLAIAAITLPTVFLEVLTGYFAHFVLWCFGTILWDWQVQYLSGCVVVALYAFYVHDSIMGAYHRWAVQHRSEVVLDRSQQHP